MVVAAVVATATRQALVVFDIDGDLWTLDLRPASEEADLYSVGREGEWMRMVW